MAWWDTVQKVVDETVRVSKQAFDKTKEFGNKAKKEFELKGKQSDAQKEFAALGGIVYRKLVEENSESISRDDEDITSVVDSINSIGDEIKALEEKITELKNSNKEQTD